METSILPVDARMLAGSADWAVAALPGGWRSRTLVADTPRSCVVRFETAAGVRYFKADRILPPSEAVVVARLARAQPEHVASVVARSARRAEAHGAPAAMNAL